MTATVPEPEHAPEHAPEPGPGSAPLDDPRAELAALGRALGAHLSRAAFFGVERAAAPAAPAAPASTAPDAPERAAPHPGPAPAAGARPAAAPTRAPEPQVTAPGPPVRAAQPSARPPQSSAGPPQPSAGPPQPSAGPPQPSERAPEPPARPRSAPAAAAAPAPREPGDVTPDPRFGPTWPAAQAARNLDALAATVAACTACGLCKTRTQTVFADGSARARVMFVGEAPGADEDRTGVPFVGRAGQLLTDIITKGMGLAREDVYIANVLKCRPPDNRDPRPEEKQLCTPYLERQIELVDPEVLIPLGRHASNHLLGLNAPMGQLRGRVHEARGRRVVPTFHPAYLLRSPAMKKPTWEDIQLAMAQLGLRPPGS